MSSDMQVWVDYPVVAVESDGVVAICLDEDTPAASGRPAPARP